MRDRLIELISQADEECKHTKDCKSCSGYGKGALCMNYHIADHLLANGVVCPPYKVGSPIYRIIGENTLNPKIAIWDIVSLIIYPDEIGYVDDTDNWIPLKDFGKTVFLTREEAERALKGEAE